MNATRLARPRDGSHSSRVTQLVSRAGTSAQAIWLEKLGGGGQGINRGTGRCPCGGNARATAWTLGCGCHPSSCDYWGPDKRELGRGSWGVSQQGQATVPRFFLSLTAFLSEHLPTFEPLSLNFFLGLGSSSLSPHPSSSSFPLSLSSPFVISTPSLGRGAREVSRGGSPRHQ